MRKLSNVYADNVAQLDRLLRVEENFDVIKKPLRIGQDEVTLYYIDGFVKDTVMQKLMLRLTVLGVRAAANAPAPSRAPMWHMLKQM